MNKDWAWIQDVTGALERMPPAQRQELYGLARAADVPVLDLVTLAVTEKLRRRERFLISRKRFLISRQPKCWFRISLVLASCHKSELRF